MHPAHLSRLRRLALSLVALATFAAPLSRAQDARAEKAGASETKANLDRLKPFLEQQPETKAAIEATVPDKPAVPFKKPRKVLVLTRGTMGILHTPGAAGLLLLLRAADAKYDDLTLTEAFTDYGLTLDKLKEFDAVVLNNVGRVDNKENESFYTETLPAYVRQGGGLWANHSAAHMFFDLPDNPYNRMLGGFSSKAMVHPKPRHGHPFEFKLVEPDHPLLRAFHTEPKPYALNYWWYAGTKEMRYTAKFTAPAQLADELNIVNKESNRDGLSRVLARVADETPDRYPADLPVYSRSLIWVRAYDKGRVYYTQFGHNFALFSVECVARSMLDGLQYATGDLEAPDAPTPAK